MIIVIVYSHVSEEFDFVNKEPGKHYGPRQIAVETQHELHDNRPGTTLAFELIN